MLARLTIQNVVLIERLTLDGAQGLAALTGETGAGKSILLDALGLALGARADAGLVRHGADQASVTAQFDLQKKHPAFTLLVEKDIPAGDGELILRRVVAKDGRSKAYVNDAPVSVQTLKELGAHLVEIHGQFDTQGLLDPETHIRTLDIYAGLDEEAGKIARHFQAWRAALRALQDAETNVAHLKMQEEYLRHVVAELDKLDPRDGEETVLAEKRHRLMNLDKRKSAFEAATTIIDGEDGLQAQIARLQMAIERLPAGTDETAPLRDTLQRLKAETEELSWQVEKLATGGEDDADTLEKVEERYFALREAARKHRTTADQLPGIHAELSQKLKLITNRDETLHELQKKADAERTAFAAKARDLSEKRKKAAQKLGKAVNAELPDLKLDKAAFSVACDATGDEKLWHARGIDRVQFVVSTNPQTPPGPIHKIASGGELSRFMLALKVILAETGSVPTLIFDEVDSGIGGATADAVGERLQRLAAKYQVLVVTHSPQVAARAAHHWHVAKRGGKDGVKTDIAPLGGIKDRQEEIARMLSGAEITREARAQAAKLLEQRKHAAA